MTDPAATNGTGTTTHDEVRRVVGEIAQRFGDRQQEITRALTTMIAREVARLDEDPLLVELLEASVHGNITTMIHVLANDIPTDHLQPATAAVEYALRLAQRDVSSHSLVRAYHLGQNEFIRMFVDEVRSMDLPTNLAFDVIENVSSVVSRYIDRITLDVFDAYEKERQRWSAVRGNVHSALIHGLVEGTETDTAAFESETGYRLDRCHVALIVWSTVEPADGGVSPLDRLVRGIAAHLRADGPPILTAVDRRTVWAWLPFGRRPPAIDTAELAAVVGTHSTGRVAVGLPATGQAGFCRSHEQARAAYSIAMVQSTSHRRVIGFGDRGVAVVSLLARNLDAARAWVGEVLGPLADDTEQAAMLRATLSTYFATGESHLHTAERMNLHRNTVKYRVGKALGDPTRAPATHDKLDVALALQACEYLGSSVLR
ncbi:helix-turn-helix domain-containing protein [Rhodococcus sp. HM1]|uniref:PucR family transcriptional regulator n=1 Tax=unclassified Rhodococcus (in: high G+C Gram-positive bacteria) TaxID=192944 RepID=UPI00200AA40F|nr:MULTISPECIES: helix-turn-helix domain-containing protein [unclassified Rhodococcus (in: high G+C Gram-positive bacteria)]MCK8675335.1 helix-turn-helix domain-containing protein [Rhodococcus sp. HM1]